MTTITRPGAAPSVAQAHAEPLLVSIGRGGALIHYRRRYTGPDGYMDARLTTHEGSEEVRAALAAGCAMIDTRPMTFGDVTAFTVVIARLAEARGAYVKNVEGI